MKMEHKPFRQGLDPENLKLWISPTNPKRNRKLDRRRGLAWEDELTRYLRDNHKLGDAYNLGGSTTYIPDIILFSNYVYVPEKDYKQYRLDLPSSVIKFYTDHSITAIECKFTTAKELKIPKEDIDKGFEFISRLDKYQRFVVLAAKFQTSKQKSKKFFLVMKWDYAFISADYSYLFLSSNGDYDFMVSNGVGKKSVPHEVLGTKYFRRDRIKLERDNLRIEDV